MICHICGGDHTDPEYARLEQLAAEAEARRAETVAMCAQLKAERDTAIAERDRLKRVCEEWYDVVELRSRVRDLRARAKAAEKALASCLDPD